MKNAVNAMKTIPIAAALSAAAFCAGCFTIVQTQYPRAERVSAPESAPPVKVEGFAAEVVRYIPVYGWETRYVAGWPGRRGRRGGWFGGHYETVATETAIAQTVPTDAYRVRARKRLEDSGIVADGPSPAYSVSVDFTGPRSPEGTGWRAALVDCGSLFFALYDATLWSADLRIRDLSTGRVVLSETIDQEYECCAFSPFWLFGLACSNDIDAAYITAEDSAVTYYETLQDAFDAYPGGKATITLRRDVAENDLTLAKTTYLDLAGYDVQNTGYDANGTLYIFDSETDDYTVKNGNGYGLINGDIAAAAEGLPMDSDIVTAVKPTDLYLKITEDDGTSFHRLNLRFAGLTLRPDSLQDGTYWPGLFYKSQFGGDEVVKRNITYYGIGMSAIDGEEMFTRDNSYTEIAAENWQVGADADGNSLNMTNGTILTGIMKTTNPSIINRRNGGRAVRGQNYVLLLDGTRIVGPEISFSLQDVFEGNGINGVDDRWETWSAQTQTDIKTLYTKFSTVMRFWNIPNIKEAVSQ